MKVLSKLLLIISVSFLLFTCGGSSSTPETVVEKYFEAVKNVDFDGIRSCLTKDAVVEFDSGIASLSDEDIKLIKEQNAGSENVKILRSEINGDNAIVYFEQAHGDHSHEYPISLKKENGKWKIADQ